MKYETNQLHVAQSGIKVFQWILMGFPGLPERDFLRGRCWVVQRGAFAGVSSVHLKPSPY